MQGDGNELEKELFGIERLQTLLELAENDDLTIESLT
jgi:hypothetical protein